MLQAAAAQVPLSPSSFPLAALALCWLRTITKKNFICLSKERPQQPEEEPSIGNGVFGKAACLRHRSRQAKLYMLRVLLGYGIC